MINTVNEFDRTEKTLWFGPEIEYSRHYGEPTLFICGTSTLEKLTNALKQFPETTHMFFQRRNDVEIELFQTDEELQIIQSYLDSNKLVSIQTLPTDITGKLLQFLIKNKNNKNLCVVVQCHVPNLNEIGNIVDIKLDDPLGVGGPNGGVWVMTSNHFKSNAIGYTDWDEYDVDILIE